ncbi:helix-turn-helix domain-containing protein [Streptomyces chisholmiae]|uniref:helix-turn-helix domain-containing protein n=1 Tax=Streptomyces chisholmiae TaxID=3075540 RepID=UPI00288AEF46|nr:helix-turn-helix transcriptional regulator [Streptomyces sp. DSM 44915]
MRPNGAAIKALRTTHQVSLRCFAQLIDRDHVFLHRIESGERGASPETLQRIAAALDVPVAAITRENP